MQISHRDESNQDDCLCRIANALERTVECLEDIESRLESIEEVLREGLFTEEEEKKRE